MEQVVRLSFAESGKVDYNAVAALKAAMGAQRYAEIVEDVVRTLTDKIGTLMEHARSREFALAERQAAKIGAISRQIGLLGVASVAAMVQDCAGKKDYVALSAVSVRLASMAERALYCIIEFDEQAP